MSYLLLIINKTKSKVHIGITNNVHNCNNHSSYYYHIMNMSIIIIQQSVCRTRYSVSFYFLFFEGIIKNRKNKFDVETVAGEIFIFLPDFTKILNAALRIIADIDNIILSTWATKPEQNLLIDR